MADFVSIAARLLAARKAADAPEERPETQTCVSPPPDTILEEVGGAVACVKLAAFEVYERAVERALERFGEDVLGRELQRAPADVEAIARRALQLFPSDEPIALVVSGADASRICSELPVRVDPSLSAGDLYVEVRDGSIDLRLCVRRRTALREALEEAQ